MNAYEIRVNGRNVLIESDDRLEKYGFFTNIYLRAGNEDEAEYKAMDILRANTKLRSAVRNEKSDPPTMHVDEISEISNYDEIEPKEQGLIWYREEEDEL